MNILKFITDLLPSLEKKDVLEDLRVTIADLRNNIIPSYKVASEYFKANKFTSKENDKLASIVYTALGRTSGNNKALVVTEIYSRLEKFVLVLESVADKIEDKLEKTVMTETLSVDRSYFIAIASMSTFVSRYASDLLNYIYMLEESARGAEDAEVTPAMKKSIDKNLKQLIYILDDLGIDLRAFEKRMEKIPDVIMNDENYQSMEVAYGTGSLDVIDSRINNFSSSPIYKIRLVIAQWQATRYKKAKDTKKVLELRLLHLKLLNDNKNDAKLEQEINYIQSRVDKLNREIADVDDDLGM